jgi:hypothetical protein
MIPQAQEADMSEIPEGITQMDLQTYANMKRKLDVVLPAYEALEKRIKAAYADTNAEITKQRLVVVDEAGLVITLKPRTSLDAELFEDNVPYSNPENEKYYTVKPNPAEIQKDFQKTYYRVEKPSVSVSIAE